MNAQDIINQSELSDEDKLDLDITKVIRGEYGRT